MEDQVEVLGLWGILFVIFFWDLEIQEKLGKGNQGGSYCRSSSVKGKEQKQFSGEGKGNIGALTRVVLFLC